MNWKTTFYQYLIFLPLNSFAFDLGYHILIIVGLFTLHNYCVYNLYIESLELESESGPSIPVFLFLTQDHILMCLLS